VGIGMEALLQGSPPPISLDGPFSNYPKDC
jgi:hypothetical protein